MRDISVHELAKRRSAGDDFMLLDVREPDELALASIAGAHHIPMRDIPARINELAKDRAIVVMCHHGGRSERVARHLEAMGFTDVSNLEGGIAEWSAKIDPNVPRY